MKEKSHKKPSPLSKKINRHVLFGTSLDLPRIIELRLDEIQPNPDQPRKRFNEESLRELADSIREKGLIQPITVKKGETGYILVAGERRYRAFRLLKKETIPAIQTEGNVDEISLIENIQREGLHPLEEAEAMARMMERYGYTQAELGKVVGKKQSTVSEILKLNALPEQIKREYQASDSVSKSLVIEVVRLKDPREQLALWKRLKQGRPTVQAARATKKGESPSRPRTPAERMLAAGHNFMTHLGALSPEALSPKKYAELLALKMRVDELVKKIGRTRKRR
jgi:ParB family transcriptional regulator, chromosome partitioning protein